MKVIRDTVGLAADITGILAFVGLSAAGITAWMGSRANPVVSISLAAFVLLLIVYIGLKKFVPDFAERAFRRPPTNKPLLLQAYDLKSRLPADDILQELQAELDERVQKWDEKARLVSSELYASISHEGQLYTLSILAQSVWKKREAEFSIKADGKQKTGVMEHYEPLNDSVQASMDTAFFGAFPDWRDKVVSAYGPMEHYPKDHLYVKVSTIAAKKGLQVSVRDDSREADSFKMEA